MTLTDFLLARIAEEEADAMPTVHEGRVASINGGKWSNGRYYITRSPARVLAECEAKRELVTGDSAITFAEREGRGPSELHRYVMGVLAMPYANHPDYRQEWKP